MVERRAESGYLPLKAVKRLNGMSRDLFDEVLSERKFLTKRTLFKNNESRTPGPSFLIHHPVSGRHEFVGLTPELFVIERERERGTNDYRVSGRRRIDSRCWARYAGSH